MQSCDSKCSWCAANFWSWVKARMKQMEKTKGRSGEGSFAQAAATSVRAE